MGFDHCDLLCLDVPAAEAIRNALPGAATIATRARFAKACADPTRLALLLALDLRQELCVCDLTWIVSRPQNLVSHHLRRLREAGLVSSRREAKIVFYAITPVGARSVAALAAAGVEAGR